jgi:hypothetical protein
MTPGIPAGEAASQAETASSQRFSRIGRLPAASGLEVARPGFSDPRCRRAARGKEILMRTSSRLLSVFALAASAFLVTAPPAARAAAAPEPAPEPAPEHFVGHLIDTMASARFTRPFILEIDRYASAAEAQRLTGVLAARGRLGLRDDLWKSNAGYLSVGGGLGYPIAAAFVEDTPAGRTIRVFLDRPLGFFETQYYFRSYRYPFTVIELTVDKDGNGEGRFILAANLQSRGADTLEVESLGAMPFRLLHVRAS